MKAPFPITAEHIHALRVVFPRSKWLVMNKCGEASVCAGKPFWDVHHCVWKNLEKPIYHPEWCCSAGERVRAFDGYAAKYESSLVSLVAEEGGA